MELVQRLHERGVVHRDLHLDNVMFRAETESWTANDVVSGELVLIDFGLSVFFPDTADFGLDWYVDDGMSPWLMSPWQLDKVRAGRRDDLFRVLEMLAMNLGLGRFDRGVRRLSRRMGIARHAGPQLRAFEMTVAKRYKNDCNFFLFDETLKSEAGENVSDSVQRLAMQQPLEAALSYVRSIAHPDDEPNYELVSQFMKDALLAIQ
jgi:serine/threonine protein kinase